MFEDVQFNKQMIMGAYKRVKSYYYYNKNFIVMKKKIAEFEYDEKKFDERIEILANILNDASNYKDIISGWLDRIDAFIMPKSYYHGSRDQEVIEEIHNEIPTVEKVNYFIDIPIELYILDTLWTLLIGKILYDRHVLPNYAYGNVIDYSYVYKKDEEGFLESIKFDKNRFFIRYYDQYTKWKNEAIKQTEKSCKKEDVVLVSLDVKEFFYSVDWKFEIIEKKIDGEEYRAFENLTSIIKTIYSKYSQVLTNYKRINKEQGVTPLPIGLFSAMVFANVYLSDFDDSIANGDNTLYYGRYVDDILLVLRNVNHTDSKVDLFDKILTSNLRLLSKRADGDYSIYGYDNLIIQSQKIKSFFINCIGSRAVLKAIKAAMIVPSMANIIPDSSIILNSFDEDVYGISEPYSQKKLRDILPLEVNVYNLSSHMASLVEAAKRDRTVLDSDEKGFFDKEATQILAFFKGNNACEYASNWTNVFYFFVMKNSNKNFFQWNSLKDNIANAIENVQLAENSDLESDIHHVLVTKIREYLSLQFETALSTAMCINPNGFISDEKGYELALKIRKANMFNLRLSNYPLIYYSDNLDADTNLVGLSYEAFKQYSEGIFESRKIKLNPCFIHFEELLLFEFFRNDCDIDYLGMENVSFLDSLYNTYYTVNNISISHTSKSKILDVDKENKQGYTIYNYKLMRKPINKQKIKIAVGNIRIDAKQCLDNLDGKIDSIVKYTEFIEILRDSFKIDDRTNIIDKVDFIVLPEFFLPIEWLQEVMAFVRKSQITIITGLQYVTEAKDGKMYAHNRIAVLAPLCSNGFPSSCIIIREKNDYAPFEKELLALKDFECSDADNSVYYVIDSGDIKYGTFLCYEFTDIIARALYKNNVDILFAPEHNNDTSYFSSIVESMVRDLHIFIVQANTSIYGDSRITGPYGKNDRNIVQVKGGDNNTLIIGTLNVEEIQEHRIKDNEWEERQIEDLRNSSDKSGELEKRLKEKAKKISRVSARR